MIETKYEAQADGNTYSVRRATLYYMENKVNEQEYEVVPVWIFNTVQNETGKNLQDIVNAQTGEEIIWEDCWICVKWIFLFKKLIENHFNWVTIWVDIDVLYKIGENNFEFYISAIQERIPPFKIIYMRRTGEYGAENYKWMDV